MRLFAPRATVTGRGPRPRRPRGDLRQQKLIEILQSKSLNLVWLIFARRVVLSSLARRVPSSLVYKKECPRVVDRSASATLGVVLILPRLCVSPSRKK